MSEVEPQNDRTSTNAMDLAESLKRSDRREKLDGETLPGDCPHLSDACRSELEVLDTVTLGPGATQQGPTGNAEPDGGILPRDFGGYVLLDRLGSGGMGEVYRAEHRHMERVVAVKMLHSKTLDSREAVERFHREVKAAAKLAHPHVVTAYDAGEVDGVQFLAMEFVDGGNLQSLVKKAGPLSVPQAVNYIVQAARGLEFAHRKKVIHRDVKPANLLLDREGTIKLLDLGLARLETPLAITGPSGSGGLTQSGQIMGTIDYMSPEQALDTKHAGESADIYSLGCTLHFLLTGRVPYPAGTPMERIIAHRERPIPSLCDARSDVPQSLNAVFQRMVAKKPEERQASMTEVISQLAACLPVQARDAGPWPYPSPGVGGVDTAVSQAAPEAATRMQADDSSLSRGQGFEATSDWPMQPPPARRRSPDPAGTPDPEVAAASARPTVASVARSGDRPQRGQTQAQTQPQPQRQSNGRRRVLIGALVAAALAVVALGVLIRMRTADGVLVLDINEPGAKVAILDEAGQVEIERSGGQGSLRISVDPGKHRLKIEKEGFQFFTAEFIIESGGIKKLEGRLEPLCPPVPSAAQPDQPPPLAVSPFTSEEARAHQERWARYLRVPVAYENSIGMKFVLIPPGEFDMGSTEAEVAKLLEQARPTSRSQWDIDHLPAEAPKHRVRITKPFWLGVHEVTRGQFRRFVEECGYQTEAERDGKGGYGHVDGQWKQDPRFVWNQDPGTEQADDTPVVNVSWNDVNALCAWLSEKEEAKSYLPSEAQWEYACRAGTTTRWSSGDDEGTLNEHGWFNSNAENKSHPAGRKSPNAWGLCDMHGNACEWCQDFWAVDCYRASPRDDPLGASTGPGRVVRGGTWFNVASDCRASFRHWEPPGYREEHLGCRLARIASLPVSGAARPKNEVAASPEPTAPPTPKPSAPAPSLAAKPTPPWTLPAGAPPPAIAPFDEKRAQEHQVAWAKYLGLMVETENSVGMKMVLIPPGEFLMGNSEEQIAMSLKECEERKELNETRAKRLRADGPQHRVRITAPFRLAAHEVTIGQFRAFVAATGYKTEAERDGKGGMGWVEAGGERKWGQRPEFNWRNAILEQTDRHPVVNVSWNDAVAFCRWLSEEEGGTYRLPTEAQWEYACRSGTTTRWFLGENRMDHSQFSWIGVDIYQPVGKKLPNPFGIFDMYGNVREWCSDWYMESFYRVSPTDDPQGPPVGDYPVVRGGAFCFVLEEATSASRDWHGPRDRSLYDGFRVASAVDDSSNRRPTRTRAESRDP